MKKKDLKKRKEELEEQLSPYVSLDEINKDNSKSSKIKEYNKRIRSNKWRTAKEFLGGANIVFTALMLSLFVGLGATIGGLADTIVLLFKNDEDKSDYSITYIYRSTDGTTIKDNYVLDKKDSDSFKIVLKDEPKKVSDHYETPITVYDVKLSDENLKLADEFIDNGYYYTLEKTSTWSKTEYSEILTTETKSEASVSYEYKDVEQDNSVSMSDCSWPCFKSGIAVGVIAAGALASHWYWDEYKDTYGDTRKDIRRKRKELKRK